jgi:hypothetical protein
LETVDGRAQAGRDGHGKRPFQRPAGESPRLCLAALLAVITQAREGEYRHRDVTASAMAEVLAQAAPVGDGSPSGGVSVPLGGTDGRMRTV